MRALGFVAAMILVGCNRPDVTSHVYKHENGETAFIIDRYEYGFTIRGPDAEGKRSLDVLKVNLCKGGQLWWDRANSLIFHYDSAEILYLSDVSSLPNKISIAACRNSNVLCASFTPSPSGARIPISC